jgi:hypothetical protein
MHTYREILQMHKQGFSGRSIAASCGGSRNTVAKVVGRAQELKVAYSPEMSVNELEKCYFRKNVQLECEVQTARLRVHLPGVGKKSSFFFVAFAPFQRKPGCRKDTFEEEREYLLPLPKQPYNLAV